MLLIRASACPQEGQECLDECRAASSGGDAGAVTIWVYPFCSDKQLLHFGKTEWPNRPNPMMYVVVLG